MGCWTLAVLLTAPLALAADDADALYANRTSLVDARKAAAIWQQQLAANASDLAAASKLARASYWLGGHLDTEPARLAAFETGMDAARKAVAAQPSRPDGYFWLAANMGGFAELKGKRAGLKYRSAIRENLEKARAIDPAFQKGSPDRALGRWYFKVPGLFGGSNRKSEQHLRAALTFHPASIVTRLFLAETLADMRRKDEAIKLLREIETLPVDPEWAPEDGEFKQQARTMLKRLL